MLTACDKLTQFTNKGNGQGNRPDLDCIIANDFYAVHFSSYIQPKAEDRSSGTKLMFVPYCQKIPSAGKMFFTADLIDRDIRNIPIGIKLVEVDKLPEKGSNSDFQEIRTVLETSAKLYPKGTVEIQADVDKNGNYLLYLLIGEGIEEDDQFKIPLEIGVDPNALPINEIVAAIGGFLTIIVLIVFFFIRRKKQG